MFYWSALKRISAAMLVLLLLWALAFWAMGGAR